jgi:hypothetical protein
MLGAARRHCAISWKSRRVKMGVGCKNSVLPANQTFCDARPNLRTSQGKPRRQPIPPALAQEFTRAVLLSPNADAPVFCGLAGNRLTTTILATTSAAARREPDFKSTSAPTHSATRQPRGFARRRATRDSSPPTSARGSLHRQPLRPCRRQRAAPGSKGSRRARRHRGGAGFGSTSRWCVPTNRCRCTSHRPSCPCRASTSTE